MSAVSARNCLLAVLLTAAVLRSGRTLADMPSSAPLDVPATLRCEPGPDFSAPARTTPAAQDEATFAGFGTDRTIARPVIATALDPRLRSLASALPARTWLFIRSSARTSVYVGVNRRGVAGLHFFQHPPVAASIGPLAPRGGG